MPRDERWLGRGCEGVVEMSYRTIELELDDVSYILDYEYSRPRPATRWEPAEGGLTPTRLTLVLDGFDGPIQIDVTEHMDNLKVIDQLVSRAENEEREIA